MEIVISWDLVALLPWRWPCHVLVAAWVVKMPMLNSHSDQAEEMLYLQEKNNHFGGFAKVDASATNAGF